MKRFYYFFLLLMCLSLWTPAIAKKMRKQTRNIRIIPMMASVENNDVRVTIELPKDNSLVDSDDVWLQIRVRNYPLGGRTQLPRADELINSPKGQSLHVVIDNRPYLEIISPRLAPFDEEGNIWDERYRFRIPFRLHPGLHYVRVFPVRSYGESLKMEGSFDANTFYLDNRGGKQELNLQGPYLTYNEPTGSYSLKEKEPLLLDFYLTNCQLSQDGYKVLLTIDRSIDHTLTRWQPYYIYGLEPGEHMIRLRLLDRNNRLVGSEYNDIERKVLIQ